METEGHRGEEGTFLQENGGDGDVDDDDDDGDGDNDGDVDDVDDYDE